MEYTKIPGDPSFHSMQSDCLYLHPPWEAALSRISMLWSHSHGVKATLSQKPGHRASLVAQ